MSHQSESEQHAVADKETIVKELKKILVEDLFVSIPEGEIKLEDSLSSDLGVDSVGWVELVTILEEKYGIEITGDEAASENLWTLDRLSGLVLAKIAARRGERGGEQVDTYDDFAGVVEELADAYRVSGEALIVTTACAAGTNAIGIAKDMIRHEGYEVVICGGVDTLDRMKYLGHSALNTLTPTLIRPFTPERDGTLFGEGAGILVLERESLAQDHSVYAACAGAGYSCDAHHIT